MSTRESRDPSSRVPASRVPLSIDSAQQKPKRRTRERALEVSLKLFNDFGEPNVTTTTISEAMQISPGNLYYHFRNKDEIVNDLFVAFARDMHGLLVAVGRRAVTVEDIWLFLHVLFETIWKHRFLYRDISDLLSRNRLLEVEFKRLLAEKVATTESMLRSLASTDALDDANYDLGALATNMIVVATYWLSYAFAREPRRFEANEVSAQGAYQVISLLAPYLKGDGKLLFMRLAAEYNAAQNVQDPRRYRGNHGEGKLD